MLTGMVSDLHTGYCLQNVAIYSGPKYLPFLMQCPILKEAYANQASYLCAIFWLPSYPGSCLSYCSRYWPKSSGWGDTGKPAGSSQSRRDLLRHATQAVWDLACLPGLILMSSLVDRWLWGILIWLSEIARHHRLVASLFETMSNVWLSLQTLWLLPILQALSDYGNVLMNLIKI